MKPTIDVEEILQKANQHIQDIIHDRVNAPPAVYDLIDIVFDELYTTLTTKHQEEIEKVVEAEMERIVSKDKECEEMVVKARLDAFKEVYESKEFQTLIESLPTKTDKQ